jgi:thiosulfate dehydrogenase
VGSRARAGQRTVLACIVAGLLASATYGEGEPPQPSGVGASAAGVALSPPGRDAIPDGPLGAAIRQGEHILTRTAVYARAYVGARLNCTSCHLDGGRQADAAPWVGLWGLFPAYSDRSGTVETLEDRINHCFERSMNGTPLPGDGVEMRAILAYMAWLSRGVPTGTAVTGRGFARIRPPREPARARGKEIYLAKCVACHQADGQGVADPDGAPVFPPLWGEHSFNIGAGMARLDTAAAFVRAKMPLGQGGTLSDQDAYDVAAYFTREPRPDFPGKDRDWPRGHRPADARY